MPTCYLGSAVQQHVPCPPTEVVGETLRAALEALFLRAPKLRAYLLDDQGALRHHVEIFVDGDQIRDRIGLSDAVSPAGEVRVYQALSGG